jgi:hypothetical protein
MNSHNLNRFKPENMSNDELSTILKDYLANESRGYGDNNAAITFGESLIIDICKELKSRVDAQHLPKLEKLMTRALEAARDA